MGNQFNSLHGCPCELALPMKHLDDVLPKRRSANRPGSQRVATSAVQGRLARTALSCIAIPLALACFAGCKPASTATAARQPDAPANVKIAHPRRGEITRTISLPAVIVANQQATLYSKVAGYLKTIAVDKGDDVKQGQLLAEIEAPELLADVARYQAEAQIAELDYRRAADTQTKAPDLVPLQTVDTAKAKWQTATAALERARTLLDFCRITAPFSGVITRRAVDPGAFIPAATSGSAAQNAAVVTLMDFDTVRVQLAVPEPEVPLIRKELTAKVVVDELPGKVFDGRVARFTEALDDASKTMLTEIDLANPKHELRPGMFANVKLGIEKHAEALLVPADAVVFERAGASVFTVADGKAKKVPVKTGFNDGQNVELVDGLAPDQSVILVGKSVLNNGQAVIVTEEK